MQQLGVWWQSKGVWIQRDPKNKQLRLTVGGEGSLVWGERGRGGGRVDLSSIKRGVS